MRGSPLRFRLVFVHVDYILARINKYILIVLGLLALINSLIAFYTITPTYSIVSFYILGTMFFLLAISIGIVSLLDELDSGRSALYLVAGLSRREYIISWIISTIVFPILGFLLSIVLPLTIINPRLLMIEVDLIGYRGFSVPLYLILLSIAIQLFNNTSIIAFLSISLRNRVVAIVSSIFFSFLLPLVLSFIAFMIHTNDVYHVLFFISPFYYVTMSNMAYVNAITYIFSCIASFIVGVLFTIGIVGYVGKYLEV